MAEYQLKIPEGPYKTIAADPPWPFNDRLPGPGRGAAKHYDTMSLTEIENMGRHLIGGLFCDGCGLELDPGSHGCMDDSRGEFCGTTDIPSVVPPNAHLYLWAPNSFVHDAWEIAQAWGFEPKTVLTWVKVTNSAAHVIATEHDLLRETTSREPDWNVLNTRGVARIGMGRTFRNATEHVIVATRGKLDYLRKDVPNVFFAPRGGHSVKPNIFYDIVEAMSPGPYLELFAGRERPGWTCLVPPEGD